MIDLALEFSIYIPRITGKRHAKAAHFSFRQFCHENTAKKLFESSNSGLPYALQRKTAFEFEKYSEENPMNLLGLSVCLCVCVFFNAISFSKMAELECREIRILICLAGLGSGIRFIIN